MGKQKKIFSEILYTIMTENELYDTLMLTWFLWKETGNLDMGDLLPENGSINKALT